MYQQAMNHQFGVCVCHLLKTDNKLMLVVWLSRNLDWPINYSYSSCARWIILRVLHERVVHIFRLVLEKAQIALLLMHAGQLKNDTKKKSIWALLIKERPSIILSSSVMCLGKIGNSEHLIVLMKNLYTGYETTGWKEHDEIDCLQVGKSMRQNYILFPYSIYMLNIYIE